MGKPKEDPLKKFLAGHDGELVAVAFILISLSLAFLIS